MAPLEQEIGSPPRVGAHSRVSGPGEFHPEPLVEPYVKLSLHTAPIIQGRVQIRV